MKKLFCLSMLMCSCVLCGAQAISVTVDNQTPGWLSSKINYGDQITLQNLKVTGFLNADDLKFIGTLIKTHNLSKVLDLYDCQIVNSDGEIENYFSGDFLSVRSTHYIEKLVFPIKLEYSNNSLKYLYVDTLVAGGENMPIIKENMFSSEHIKNLIIREGVDSIADWTFSEDILETIELPSSLKSIGAYAFEQCKSLTSVTIGNMVSIGNSVTSIGDHAFFDCDGLTSVTIGNSVTSIGSYAFKYCSGLTEITIPNSVTNIGEEAFFDCDGLTSVTIPNSVTSIGDSAFGGCDGLESIIVEPGNSMYDSRDNCNAIIETSTNTLIAGCKNTTIPFSATSIGSDAFYGCTGLTSVVIPNSVTSIGFYAFGGCRRLTSVTIPNSVTTIGDYAFRGCTGLTSVTIGNSVTSIGDFAFYKCTGLTSVTIPNSVTSIGSNAFDGCVGLSDITIHSLNISISSTAFDNTAWYNNQPDGILYLDKFCYGYKGEEPSGELNIKEGTLAICDYAFSGCDGLTSVIIPNSVIYIGGNPVSSCNGLESIIVEPGNSVYDSRDNCNAIIETSTNTLIAGCKNTIIPNSVTSIGSYAFSGCERLNWVSIGNSVTSIGDYAFRGCLRLIGVTSLNPTPPICGIGVFNEIPDYTHLYVPENSISAYKSAEVWKNFYNIIAGITDVVADEDNATEVARYDINGRLLSKPAPGINIIKMSDGTTRKEWVK